MKKKYLLTSVCILLVQLFSLQSFSQVANYYVSTTGNDNNAGTLAAPYLTLKKALTKAVVAGDTIFVRSGKYQIANTLSASKSGTAGKPIVITVYKPDMVTANSRPILDFGAMTLASGNRGIALSGNYWYIYGLVIDSAGDNGMNVSGSHNTIEFCDFTRNRDAGIQLGGGASYDNLINCDSYQNADLGTGSTTAGGNADGFSPKLDVGDSIYLKGCRSWLNSDDGYDGYIRPDAGQTVPASGENWVLEDCWSFRNGYYWLDGSTTSSENGMGFKTGGSDADANGLKTQPHNCRMIRCLSFENKGHGFDQNSNAGTIRIYNCTAFHNVSNDIYMTSPSVKYIPGANLVVENTITFGAQGTSLPAATVDTPRPATYITNSFNKTSATTNAEIVSFDTTGVTGMRDVNGNLPVLNFMHLNTNAPTPYQFIDKGTIEDTVPYHGALGVTYNGAAPDLGAFETPASVVPVKMLSFTAVTNTSGVALNWQMASEIQNKGWYVERATGANSASWTDLGFVNGAGTSFTTTDYSYLDATVSSGTYYYRLKQIDADGNINYSNIIFVKIDNGNTEFGIAAYPNPFTSSATLRYTLPENAPVLIKVYDLQGKLISVLVDENEEAGTYQKLINGQHLAAGRYIVQLIAGSETATISIIKE